MTTTERMKELMERTAAQRIVCAAVRIDVDKIICSPRHFDAICRATISLLPEAEQREWYVGEQGFVDNFGQFLTREEARIIAVKQKQIRSRCGNDLFKLWSENMY